ncbi:MAG: glycosyl transferase family 90 [Pseudomonadota bacterium]
MAASTRNGRHMFNWNTARFIKEQTRLRMGQFYRADGPSFKSRIKKLSEVDITGQSARPFIIFTKKNKKIQIIGKSKRDHHRNYHFIEDIKKYRNFATQVLIADFQDCIPWQYEPFEKYQIPVFAKNRPVEGNSPVILWTNRNYRYQRHIGLSGKFNICPWEEKKSELIWRGSPHGHLRLSEGKYVYPDQIFFELSEPHRSLGRKIAGEYDAEDFCSIANSHLIRYRLISEFSSKFDFAFVVNHKLLSEIFLDFLRGNYRFAEKINQLEVARNKYVLVLEGNDAGTQINWALSSNSVILMPEREFHSTTTLGLREWVHYVPVSKDLSDLEERVEWCRSNDDACREIARNAMAYAAQFQPRVEDAINRNVLREYQGGTATRRVSQLLEDIFGE